MLCVAFFVGGGSFLFFLLFFWFHFCHWIHHPYFPHSSFLTLTLSPLTHPSNPTHAIVRIHRLARAPDARFTLMSHALEYIECIVIPSCNCIILALKISIASKNYYIQ